MFSPQYSDQLQLLVKTLPYINWDVFSLKGGTAINLFYQPLPRISVDIDLTYRFINERDLAVNTIHNEMQAICDRINSKSSLQASAKISTAITNNPVITKVFVRSGYTEIKIEPNFIIRGSVYEDVSKTIHPEVSKLLNINPELSVMAMSFEDVYAGKICAALNRQHPRDLFDTRLLLEQVGITPKTKDALLVYLCSNNRSVSELLNPNIIDTRELLENQFSGMTSTPFSYSDYEKSRSDLVAAVRRSFNETDVRFLLSFSAGKPEWELLSSTVDVDKIQSMPSIQWKLLNIEKMSPSKRNIEIQNIDSLFPKR